MFIELKEEQGNLNDSERYRLKLPDGSLKEGRLDAGDWRLA